MQRQIAVILLGWLIAAPVAARSAEYSAEAVEGAALGNVLVAQGRGKMDEARAAVESKQRRRLTTEARTALTRAEQVFAALHKQHSDAFHHLPKFIHWNDTARIAQRNQIRRDLIQSQLALAGVAHEIARTYEPGSEENRAGLQKAQRQYAAVYAQCNSTLAGLYARLGQARCLVELGETDTALAALDELLSQPDQPPASRALKTQATLAALETAVLPTVKRYKEAMAIYRAWAKTAPENEASGEEGRAIKYLAAVAAIEYARGLSRHDEKQAKLRGECLRAAREDFAAVARLPGPYQQKAKVKLADPLLSEVAKDPRGPLDFAAARDCGKAALDRMEAMDAEEKLPGADKTPEGRRRLAQATEARAEAIQYFRRALQLSTRDSPVAEVNAARYYLAYLCLAAGSAPEAAVLGEFLARRYPETAAGRQGAKIALSAYAQLFSEAPPGDSRNLESFPLVRMAEYVVQRWPSEPEAEEARFLLVQAAVAGQRVDKAWEYLRQLPAGSTRRGEAEIAMGRALWGQYLRASSSESQYFTGAELDRLADQAQWVLREGISRTQKSLRGGDAPASLVSAVLLLAQIGTELGQPGQAVGWLEDPQVGPKALLDNNSPVVRQEGLALEAGKTALRAYVAAGQGNKAAAAMRQLLAAAGQRGGEGHPPLFQFCMAAGADVRDQAARLRRQQRATALSRLRGAWETFLGQIADDERDESFAGLLLAAELSMALGGGIQSGGAVSSDASKCYGQAAEIYQKIVGKSAADRDFTPGAEARWGVKIRLARCFRLLHRYKDGLTLLLEVLKERETMLDAQAEAACTYQAWAAEKPEYYALAIEGSQKYREIWGWARLARQTAASPKYEAICLQAGYNAALCRLEQARLEKRPDERTRLLQAAENEIDEVRRTHPDSGGKQWYDKYEGLLSKIRNLQ